MNTQETSCKVLKRQITKQLEIGVEVLPSLVRVLDSSVTFAHWECTCTHVLYVCVRACLGGHVESDDNLLELVLSFCHVGLRDGA